MIIHCTHKLAAKLPSVSGTPLDETYPMGSWHANLYVIDRPVTTRVMKGSECLWPDKAIKMWIEENT